MKKVFGNVLAGVNYSIPLDEMPSLFLADSQNIVPTLNGYATPRGGSSVLNSTAYGSNITSFHEFVSGGTSYKFAARGSKIGLYSSGSFSDHIGSLTSSYGQWVNYGGYAIYVNGNDDAQKSDGSTGDALSTTTMTGAQCISEWGNRIWIGGYANNVALLMFSKLNDPIDFSTTTVSIGAGNILVGNSVDPITGLFQFAEMLLVGKENQIYALTGAPETDKETHRINPIYTKDKDSIGFTAKNGIVRVGNDVLFMDGVDIKRLSGIGQYGDIESISILGNIKEFFRSPDGAAPDKDYLKNAHFFHYKHKEQVWCSIPTGSATRFWFIIDYSNPELRNAMGIPKYSIFPMSGLTPLCFGGVADGAKTDIYAGGTDGRVRKLDTGYDDTATPVDAYGVWGFGIPERGVTCTSGNISAWYKTACTLNLSYVYGLRDWEDIISGTFTSVGDEDLADGSWRGVSNVVKKEIKDWMFESGDSFALKIRHNTSGETFEMRQSVFNWIARHRIY